MKLDTSSYYPKSPLDDDDDEKLGPVYGPVDTPAPEISEENAAAPATSAAAEAVAVNADPDDDFIPGILTLEDVPEERYSVITAVSHFLSWVLVPMLMPVYGTLMAFNLSILNFAPTYQKWIFTLIVAAINIMVPALAILLLKRLGVVNDVGLNQRRERTVPYIVVILCMAATAIFFWIKGAPIWLVMFFAGGAAAGIIELSVNFRWKISAHSAGIAGIVALLIRILQTGVAMPSTLAWLMVTIALTGLLGSARIWLGRHTIWQVAGGMTVGFCSVYFLTMIH